MPRPFAESAEQNREPILAVLREAFGGCRTVLEIGSGTGQHAVHMARHLPHLTWQTSDLPENHPGINAWLAEEGLENLRPPLMLDVYAASWPVRGFDGIFSANTAHIIAWRGVERLLARVGEHLNPGGRFALYGPFNYGGRFTSESNAHFDQWLKGRDPESGIRDFEALDDLARQAGLTLERDWEMPVNNRTLVWRR